METGTRSGYESSAASVLVHRLTIVAGNIGVYNLPFETSLGNPAARERFLRAGLRSAAYGRVFHVGQRK